jgi:hypothetical protein
MFNSIRNNFGAGTIQFKDVRESNYLVLNASFTYRTDNADYLAADVLEITVPDLNIDRSANTAVVMRFIDRRESYGSPLLSDGGTVLKSWIKDKNTICIEKLTAFDSHPEMIIYIQTIYLQLNQGGNGIMTTRKNLEPRQREQYLNWGSYSFCVIHPKWVFIHMFYNSCQYAYRGSDWQCVFDALPTDVKGDIPIIMGTSYDNPKAGGINISHIEDGVWTMLASERNFGFDNTGNDVFGMAYLIRDKEFEPDAPGRIHMEAARLDAQMSTMYFINLDMELMPTPGIVALTGNTYSSSKNYGIFYPTNIPEAIPSFKTWVMARSIRGSKMCIQFCSMTLNKAIARPTLRLDVLAGGTLLSMNLYETTAIMAQ